MWSDNGVLFLLFSASSTLKQKVDVILALQRYISNLDLYSIQYICGYIMKSFCGT